MTEPKARPYNFFDNIVFSDPPNLPDDLLSDAVKHGWVGLKQTFVNGKFLYEKVGKPDIVYFPDQS
jgi:hypothetical protein